MFKRFKRYMYIALFILTLTAPMVLWGALLKMNEIDPTIMEELDFDLNEKRRKATLSEVIDLKTINVELENYYNDRIPFRSVLITFKKYIDTKLEEPYKNNIEKKLLRAFNKKKGSDVGEEIVYEYETENYKIFDQAVDLFNNHALAKSEIDPYDPYIDYPIKVSENGKVLIGQSDWLYLNENNLPYYTGENFIATPSDFMKHIEPYIAFNDLCKEKGKNLVIFICPEKEEIYPEYMPTLKIYEKNERPLIIRDFLKEYTDVKYFYPKEDLIALKRNYLVYKKYDSHWSYVGGYLAMNMIKEALGIETTPLHDQKIDKGEVDTADLAYYGNMSKDALKPSFDYRFNDYKSDNRYDEVYIKNTVGAEAFKTTCSKGSDHKVFMIGDSFRGALLPFAEKDFKEFYCTSFLNMTEPFIKEQVKAASDIVIVLVERNEEIVLDPLIAVLTLALSEE